MISILKYHADYFLSVNIGGRHMKTENLHLEPLELLPQTHDFFDTQISRAVPIFIGCVFMLFTSFIIWASFAKMDDIVKAQAVLRPVDTISSIRCPVSGEVTEKLYHQNMSVKQGDLLLRTDDTSNRTELDNSRKLLSATKSQIQEDTGVLHTIESGINSSTDKNSREWIKSQAYLAEYSRQQNEIQQLQKDLEQQQNMPAALRVQQKVDECTAKVEQAQLSVTVWKNNQIVQVKNDVNTLTQQIQSLSSRIAVLERNCKDSSLYAPISGRVDEQQQLNAGDYVLAGSDLLRIIPDSGEKLKAEIIVDAAHIARIKNGQQAKLRFPGLPPSSFGQVSSVITEIPADMTVVSNTPVFEVDADVPEPYLTSKSGERIQLRPGVSAEARIIISRDTVIKMILRKLDFLN
jgi:multidrug resistance efflux pump